MALSDSQPALFLELTRRYCEPHRRYHTIEHISNMLWAGHALELDDVQVAAIWFHDAIYDVPGDDNEGRSAALAIDRLTQAGWASEDVAAVAQIIHDTKTHEPSDERSAWVLDLDLMSLGADPNVYARNARNIRAEYAIYDDETFAAGHAAILQRFLDRPKLYYTPFGAQFEQPARRNLTQALGRLRAGGKGGKTEEI